MLNTRFFNATGLDPEQGSSDLNYATVSDVAALLQHIFKSKKDIFTILQKSEHTVTTVNGNRTIPIATTNELLGSQDLPLQILGGKTGTTPRAKSNLAIISKAPKQKGHVITVILNSENAFIDTQDLLRYLNDAFVW